MTAKWDAPIRIVEGTVQPLIFDEAAQGLALATGIRPDQSKSPLVPNARRYPTQSHEMLFEAHAKAFVAFEGGPQRAGNEVPSSIGAEIR